MINYIELVINTLLRDLILKGPSSEIHLNNVTGVATNANIPSSSAANNLHEHKTKEISDKYYSLELKTPTSTTQTTDVKVAGKRVRRRRRLLYGNLSTRHRFALIAYLLGQTHDLLLKRNCCTYRELFYKNVYIPCGPMQIFNGVQEVCSMLGQSPWNLGIFSSGKGLITGPVSICMTNGDVIDCSCFITPTIIPPNFTYIDHCETTAQIVLVVEKDTIFKKLLLYNLFSAMEGKVLLVTGKGYPDVATRWLLKKLECENKLILFMIADADPFGIDIMLVYRHGSLAMERNMSDLACTSLKWLGIHPSDIVQMHVPEEIMKPVDYKKIESLLRRPYVKNDVHRELCILKQHQAKVKIDNMSLASFELFINDYIINKIKRNIFI